MRTTKKSSTKDTPEPKEKAGKPRPVSKEHELLQKIKTDPEMRAFVEAMKPRRQGKIWENDDDLLTSQPAVVKQEQVKSKKSGGDGVLLTRTHLKFENEESDEEYEDAPAAAGPGADDATAAAPVAADTSSAAFDASVDDLQYLKGKMKSEWKVLLLLPLPLLPLPPPHLPSPLDPSSSPPPSC